MKKDNIGYLLSKMTEEYENLSNNFIGLKDYIKYVEEKTDNNPHKDGNIKNHKAIIMNQ